MRSYKECLLEYVEERGFSELNFSWFQYLVQELNIQPASFQLIESIPPIEETIDLSFYADSIPSNYLVHQFHAFAQEKRSEIYQNLIQELINSEIKRLQSKKYETNPNLTICKKIFAYPKSGYYLSFSKALRNCLKASGFEDDFIQDYFEEIENDDSNSLRAIENFFDLDNYHLNIPKYGVKSTSPLVRTLAINFDSHCFYQSSKNEWTKQVVIPNSSFIKGDNQALLLDINSKAKISAIKVSGELHDIEKIEMKVGNWFNHKLEENLYSIESKSLDERLSYSFQKEMKGQLEKRFQSFYTCKEFDLTVQIQNKFTLEEVEFLRENAFSIFPFHFSNQHEYYKWISLNENGNLIIKIKSKVLQQSIFGAELKINMV